MRGHVANWAHGGPQWVREIPAKAGSLQILLVRRFPKDPNRQQRVPFVVSRKRLEAALNKLVSAEADGGHRAFQKNRLVRNGLVPVNRDNLQRYPEDGGEPADTQVTTVDQRDDMCLDELLFSKWIAGNTPMQLSVVLELHLRSLVPGKEKQEDDAGGEEDSAQDAWMRDAWHVLRREVRAY